MMDSAITARTIVSSLCWVVGFALVAASIFHVGPSGLGHLGVMFGMVGGVLNVNMFLAATMRQQRAVFNLGKEAALHRVPTLEHADR